MRFSLVAGALVLSASVSEVRSIALGASKNTRTTLVRIEALKLRIGASISKRASDHQDILSGADEADPTFDTFGTREPPKHKQDSSRVHAYSQPEPEHQSTGTFIPSAAPAAVSPFNAPSGARQPPKHKDDGSRVHAYSQPGSERRSTPGTFIPATPAAIPSLNSPAGAREPPKHKDDGSRVHAYSQPESKRRSTPGAFRTTIPSASTVDDKLPQAFTIEPVKSAKDSSNQLSAETPSPVYLIKPVPSEVTTTTAQKVEPSAATINTVDEIKGSGQPTTALLRAIEQYREEVLQEGPAGPATSMLPFPISAASNDLPVPQAEKAVETFTHSVSRTSANLSPLQDNTPAVGPIGSTSISDTDAAGLSSQ